MCHALASVVASADRLRRARERVEREGDGVEEGRIGGVAAEAERELGDGRRAGEPAEILGELGALLRDVEGAQGIEIAARLGVELRAALREQIERAAEPARGAARALREHAPHPRLTRDQPQDPRRLQVVERVEDDRVGREQRHDSKDSSGAVPAADACSRSRRPSERQAYSRQHPTGGAAVAGLLDGGLVGAAEVVVEAGRVGVARVEEILDAQRGRDAARARSPERVARRPRDPRACTRGSVTRWVAEKSDG